MTPASAILLGLLAVTPDAPPKDLLPMSGLTPSQLAPNLCVLKYRVSTQSDLCQKFCDQGLGYFYSYVWIEAARSFETALRHDPECAMAWLGLHRSLEKWGGGKQPNSGALLALTGSGIQPDMPGRFTKSPRDYALDRAKALMASSGPREQLLITAKLQEKGMTPDTKPEDRRKKAADTLNELITLYEDDTEGWFARAQVADGQNAAVPFYKALLKVDPLHPGGNHELVHHYENIQRPGLGWTHAERYMASSPGIPHAFHMQAHLATRLGKWESTVDWSSRAYRMEKEYHTAQGVKPGDDHQFMHHMETLTRGLAHDGRFAEALTVRDDATRYGYKFNPEWFAVLLGKKDWAGLTTLVEGVRRGGDKTTAAYYAAVAALEKGDTKRAAAEVDALKAATRKGDTRGNYRLWEVQGRLECQSGNGEAGVKLIKRVVDKTKADFNHHAWGGGAYFMEQWGVGALEAGLTSEAEEAFQEALAHDAGSVRGALGLWALSERLGRSDEAGRYLKVAKRCWAKADPADFDALKADMAARALRLPTTDEK